MATINLVFQPASLELNLRSLSKIQKAWYFASIPKMCAELMSGPLVKRFKTTESSAHEQSESSINVTHADLYHSRAGVRG